MERRHLACIFWAPSSMVAVGCCQQQGQLSRSYTKYGHPELWMDRERLTHGLIRIDPITGDVSN